MTNPASNSALLQILDLARWAPSGDNTQPWRFEIVSDAHVVVHGFDTRAHCVYDLNGRPSQIALGALLETFSIAASGHGLRAEFQRRTDTPETHPTFDVHFQPALDIQPDPLIAYIPSRSVQRRAMRTRPLTHQEKQTLGSSVGAGYEILWLESFRDRFRAARLMFNNAKLRLTIPEAYQVHRSIIQWNSRYSEDRVPDQAIGLDPLTLRLMQWVMQSWTRVVFFNRFLAGTLAPRLQLDLIPGLACAAHFVLVAKQEANSIDDFVSAGRALQRFWLTATQLGLQMQPEMTPLIFANYARQQIHFSQTPGTQKTAAGLAKQLEHLVGMHAYRHAVFMGRIGAGGAAKARSLRLALSHLSKS